MAKLGVDMQLVRKLAALLDETGLVELEVRNGDQSIRVSRGGGAAAVAATPAGAAAGERTVTAAAPPPTPAASAPNPNAVAAPMVGVVYLSPEPGAPAFVRVGDAVSEGQTILLIEAMKTFNPVRAPRSGRIARILVADKTPVEYGEELAIIE
jgi:acetyl-CoA carboxylase biotin carboxyl carrier protein